MYSVCLCISACMYVKPSQWEYVYVHACYCVCVSGGRKVLRLQIAVVTFMAQVSSLSSGGTNRVDR